MVKKVDKSAEEYERAIAKQAAEEKYVLKLYVTGLTPRSIQAIENIKQICEEHLRAAMSLRSSMCISSRCWPKTNRSSPPRH